MVDHEGPLAQKVQHCAAQKEPSGKGRGDDHVIVGGADRPAETANFRKGEAGLEAVDVGAGQRGREDDSGIEEIVVVLQIAGILVVEHGVQAGPVGQLLLQPHLVDVLALWADQDDPAVQVAPHIRRGQSTGRGRVGQQQVFVGRGLIVPIVGSPQDGPGLSEVVGQTETRLELNSNRQKTVAVIAPAQVEVEPAQLDTVLQKDGLQLAGTLVGKPEPMSPSGEVEGSQVGVEIPRPGRVEAGVGNSEEEVLAERKILVVDSDSPLMPAAQDVEAVEGGEGRKMPVQ